MEATAEIAIQDQDEKGKYIALLLGLRRNRQGRINTAWGNKTAFGLVETLKRILKTPTKVLPKTFLPETLDNF